MQRSDIMLEICKYSVFDVHAQTLVNTVNTQGVMGAGLALEFRLRYPDLYLDYKERCSRNEVKPGVPYLYKKENLIVLNFPTKDHWKQPSRIEWIENGLKIFIEKYRDWGVKSIAFPLLGTKNGGLDREQVLELMKNYLSNLDIVIYICLDEEIYPKSIETKMLNLLREIQPIKISEISGVNFKKVLLIKENLPRISRFRDILRIKKIGIKTYEKIFVGMYTLVRKENNLLNQKTLF